MQTHKAECLCGTHKTQQSQADVSGADCIWEDFFTDFLIVTYIEKDFDSELTSVFCTLL